jgi:hypothetical protein
MMMLRAAKRHLVRERPWLQIRPQEGEGAYASCASRSCGAATFNIGTCPKLCAMGSPHPITSDSQTLPELIYLRPPKLYPPSKSHKAANTSGFVQVAVSKAPSRLIPSTNLKRAGRFRYSPKTSGYVSCSNPLRSIGDWHAGEVLVTGKGVYGNPDTEPGLPDQA